MQRRLVISTAAFLRLVAAPPPAPLPVETPIIYVESPTGISLTVYAQAWPDLVPLTTRLDQGARDAVKSELERLAATTAITDGRLNLLAQLNREDGKLDAADAFIERAIASNPMQPLNHFQQAMIGHARLSNATSGLERWKWHRRTRAAYEAAFALDPKPIPYRYYLVYGYLEAPAIAGGDKDEALRMTQEAIQIGQKEFYVVRADVYRLRGRPEAAFADYDRAMDEHIFKLRSFVAAGDLALERHDYPRAKRYFEWAVHCRPDSPAARDGLARYAKAIVK